VLVVVTDVVCVRVSVETSVVVVETVSRTVLVRVSRTMVGKAWEPITPPTIKAAMVAANIWRKTPPNFIRLPLMGK